MEGKPSPNILGQRSRWLGFSIVWSGLLLFGLLGLLPGGFPIEPAVATVKTAPPANITHLSTIAFSAVSYVVSENIGSGDITLLISPPSSTPVSVTVFSAAIHAEPYVDFEGLRAALVISPNVAAYTISLSILDDTWVEGDEQLLLTLGFYDGVMPGTITETVVTIQDDDVAYLGINDVTVDEGAESVTLIITQSVTSTLQSRVDVRTLDGSATAPADYRALFTTAVISPGHISTTITIALHDDDEVEGAESFIVQLEDASNAQFPNGQPTLTATVTLLDNDTLPEVTVASATANERARVLPFVATLSTTWTQTVTVDYATRDGSATAPADYLATTGIFTIPPGTLSTTVLVPIHEDTVRESDENLFLTLSNPMQATLRSREIEGIIEDGTIASTLYLPGLAR